MKRNREIHAAGRCVVEDIIPYSTAQDLVSLEQSVLKLNHNSYVTMVFDAHPSSMESLKKTVEFEEHVIRHTVIKIGDSVKHNAAVKPEFIS